MVTTIALPYLINFQTLRTPLAARAAGNNVHIIVIAGQCLWSTDDWLTTTPRRTNLHDDTYANQAAYSIARLKALRPTRLHLSHDHKVITDRQ